MEGTIYRIVTNVSGNKTYGFISTIDGRNDIFFHKNDLTNCTIFQLHEGDDVIFDEGTGFNGRVAAVNVRLQRSYSSKSNPYAVSPGINPDADLSRFSEEEKGIIKNLAKVFMLQMAVEDFGLGKVSTVIS